MSDERDRSAATNRGEGYIVAAGDVPKVEPTLRYFTELRASLKNGLDVTSDLSLDVAAFIADRDRYRSALEEIHDYHCGCARPGDIHICVCQPVVVFEVLRD